MTLAIAALWVHTLQ